MSRISKKPIKLLKDVKLEIKKEKIIISGKYGKISYILHKNIFINFTNKEEIFLSLKNNNKDHIPILGTNRSIIFNMIQGVTYGFTKELELIGVGYKASIENSILKLNIGFSHTIHYTVPDDIKIKIIDNNKISIFGCDKQLVGQVAADIRLFKIPDPYKGKGIKYKNEKINIKEVKKK